MLLAIVSSVLGIYRRIKWYSLIYRAFLFFELLLPNLNSCVLSVAVSRNDKAFSINQHAADDMQKEELYSTGCSYLHRNFDKDTSKYPLISASIRPYILWSQQTSGRRTRRKHTSIYPLISASIWQVDSSQAYVKISSDISKNLTWGLIASIRPNILWSQQASDRRTHRKQTSKYPLISASIWQEYSSQAYVQMWWSKSSDTLVLISW